MDFLATAAGVLLITISVAAFAAILFVGWILRLTWVEANRPPARVSMGGRP